MIIVSGCDVEVQRGEKLKLEVLGRRVYAPLPGTLGE